MHDMTAAVVHIPTPLLPASYSKETRLMLLPFSNTCIAWCGCAARDDAAPRQSHSYAARVLSSPPPFATRPSNSSDAAPLRSPRQAVRRLARLSDLWSPPQAYRVVRPISIVRNPSVQASLASMAPPSRTPSRTGNGSGPGRPPHAGWVPRPIPAAPEHDKRTRMDECVSQHLPKHQSKPSMQP